MFSILHLSDLHRSRHEPVANEQLIAALLADRDRYLFEDPPIPSPDAIVVSGDVIHGAAVGEPDWQDSIHAQYSVARDFLKTLCDRLLDGDKSRLVLTPGNHDVCWNTAHQAMTRVPQSDYPADLRTALCTPGTCYRWSWSERALYEISDPAKYDQRLDAYWTFAEDFYAGTRLAVPLERDREFQIFELMDRRIVVASFASVDGNDCFRDTGSIAAGAIGSCALFLQDADRAYDLRFCVWHHSIQGPPVGSDYMDPSCVQVMAGHGFQLGLHGHQHVAGTSTQFVHLDERQAMAVVCAGSLCAGAQELPRGVNRQYNVIVLNDDLVGARVHVREMGDGLQFTRKRTGSFRVDGYTRVTWQRATDTAGRPYRAKRRNAQRAVEFAEGALRRGHAKAAIEALREADTDRLGYPRTLLIQALSESGDSERLRRLLQNPLSVPEIVLLISTLVDLRDFDAAQRRLDESETLDEPTRSALQGRLATRRLLKTE